eukprot:6023426-Prymnesium_polylepis.1
MAAACRAQRWGPLESVHGAEQVVVDTEASALETDAPLAQAAAAASALWRLPPESALALWER